ncbi:MAG: hypothetical protein ACD_49C00038G0049 [uncultured bacterium (gcode 4)]|uniref:EfeO-type cupredoxin-like domain-containing protein n=1 Tax=uncultured bacterium (gcode 4) TaxID=1234023 RepID=K2AEQ1_9BACT|nr:MAG: hypothetical protein ACD_49C00038G0049 [uncultured bacterium (gcode 4)]
MNKKIIILIAIIVVIISLAIASKNYIKQYSLTGDKNIPTSIPSADNEIIIQIFAFSPETLNIKVGTKVIWKQNDQMPHTIVSNEGLFTSDNLKLGDEFSFVFTKAWEYNYYCSIHPSMKGKIIVK